MKDDLDHFKQVVDVAIRAIRAEVMALERRVEKLEGHYGGLTQSEVDSLERAHDYGND